MKHIKSVNEFFGLFKSKEQKEWNDIAKEFIKRLEKVKDVNPYGEIGRVVPEDTHEIGGGYVITFDDVEIKSMYITSIIGRLVPGVLLHGEFRDAGSNEQTYRFYVDNE